MANNIVLNPQRGDSFALTGVASVYNQPSAFQPIGVTVYSTASIAANANSALAGKALTISGFANAKNNGTFLVTASTATTVTTNNAYGVVVSAAGTATLETSGFPAQYASKVTNIWSNQNGDNVTVNANAGDTLVAIIVGLKAYNQFDLLHGTAPYGVKVVSSPVEYSFSFGQLQGLNDFNANPSITDQANGIPIDIAATSVASNVLTVTLEENASPALVGGQAVLLSGTQESFLNGQSVTVVAYTAATFTTLSNGQTVQKTPAKFTASFHTSNYSNADDTGSATPAGNTWSLIANANIVDSDYIASLPTANGSVTPSVWNGRLTYTSKGAYAYGSNLATSLTASSPYQSSKWNLDGYYPSIYIFVAQNVKSGSYKVGVNSMYQPGAANNLIDWSQGAVPIFDGGVNVQVYCISGAATSGGVSASISTTDTTSNPATAPSPLTISAADGGALLSIGLMKSGNVFAPGTLAGSPPDATMTQVGNGMLVGSDARYLVEFVTVPAGTWNPGFANPLGYSMLVASVAISST
jgi:hypothetical protein